MAANLVRIASRRAAGVLVRREMSVKVPYVDKLDYPAPPCRFVEDDALSDESKALRLKEKGSWADLTQDEKAALYRLSFQRTFAEMNTGTDEWKYVIGGTGIAIAIAFLMYGFQKKFISPPLPHTMSQEYQEAQLRYNIKIRNNPVTGIASQWDYDKNEWKK